LDRAIFNRLAKPATQCRFWGGSQRVCHGGVPHPALANISAPAGVNVTKVPDPCAKSPDAAGGIAAVSHGPRSSPPGGNPLPMADGSGSEAAGPMHRGTRAATLRNVTSKSKRSLFTAHLSFSGPRLSSLADRSSNLMWLGGHVCYGSIWTFFSENEMRAIALLVVLCAISGVASAQTASECPPTPRAGDLLGCYNRTGPPGTTAKPRMLNALPSPDKPVVSEAPIAAGSPAASRNPADKTADYVDVLAEENKKLDSKLKTLCRGC